MREHKLLCHLRETCTLIHYDDSASAIFTQACQSSWLNLPLAHFPHSYSQGSLSGSVGCCHLLCVLPLAEEGQHHLLECHGVSRTQLSVPNPSFHKIKNIFYYGLRDLPLVGGMFSFCLLLLLSIGCDMS